MPTTAAAPSPIACGSERGRRSASRSAEKPAISSTNRSTKPSWISPPAAVDHSYRTWGSGLPEIARERYASAIRRLTRPSHSARRTPSSLRYGGAVPKRIFTPAEANTALDKVRPVAEQLVSLRARMHELIDAQGTHVTAIGGNGGGYAASDLNAAQAELEQ